MTAKELSLRLSRAGIPDAEVDARLLLSHFCNADAATLLAFPEREYENEALLQAVSRREAREPLQHILGGCYFYDEYYEVGPDCLIPRADTELLVEEAILRLPKGARFADLCTGSGCIALSVLAHRPDLTALAVDVSAAALAIAEKNAVRLGLSERVRFLRADLLAEDEALPLPDLLLSNPPYIRSDDIAELAPELSAEPRMALDGGKDGLTFYRSFLSRFRPTLFLLEIGYDQAAAVSALARDAGFDAAIRRDAGGCDRLAVLTRNL